MAGEGAFLGKREMKGSRNHGYNRVEKWVGEESVDKRKRGGKGRRVPV